MYRFLIILICLPILAGCDTSPKKPPLILKDEEIEEPKRTAEEIQEDEQIADTEEKKQKLIQEVGVKDIAEKKAVSYTHLTLPTNREV